MTVFELMADFDGTTRSHPVSFGLFETAGRAEVNMSELIKQYGVPLGGYSVERRGVR